MKDKSSVVLLIAIFVIAILLWFPLKLDEVFMDRLLLHQPIELDQVDAIHLHVKGEEIKKVPIDEYFHVVQWFNEYEPNRISESQIPFSDAQLIINTKLWKTILINYTDGEIYVSRTDINDNLVEYVFLDDAPNLEGFFEELVE